MKRFSFIGAVLILALTTLSACSQKTLEPVTIPIEMVEYSFNPNAVEVSVGQEVTLELTNNGLLPHELMIGREVKTTDNRPSGYTTDMFETAGLEPVVEGGSTEPEEGEHEHTGFMVVVEANGGKATVTFPVTEKMVGDWEMGCFEQDGVHYTAGMKGTFIVKP